MSGEEHYLYRDGDGGEAWLFIDDKQVLVSMPAMFPVPPEPCKPHQVRLSLIRLEELVVRIRRIKAASEKLAAILVSPEEIEAAKTDGGWTQEQLAEWGVPWPPPATWQRELKANWDRAQAEEKP